MSTWRLSWSGLRTVTELELKQRIRSRRWIWALIVWFVGIGAITSLIMLAVNEIWGWAGEENRVGPMAFGIITLFVLGMGLVIAPTFTATSINGDRNAGTLATLQATRLSPLEIAAGKLIAAWLTSAVFLVVALPFIAWSMVTGEISLLQVVVCFAVVYLLVAVVCAIGLGWSSVLSRAAGSTALTYLSVVALTVLSTGVMLLSTTLTQQYETMRVWGLPPAVQASFDAQMDRYWTENPDGDGADAPAAPIGQCTWREERQLVTHTDRVWWITVANPFVIVADAAPLPPNVPDQTVAGTADLSPLNAISYGVRYLSLPAETERDECIYLYGYGGGYEVSYDSAGNPTVTTANGTPVNVESPVKRRLVNLETPIWPWGLGVNVLLGAGFFYVAVRRLRIPYGTLPKGTRVA